MDLEGVVSGHGSAAPKRRGQDWRL